MLRYTEAQNDRPHGPYGVPTHVSCVDGGGGRIRTDAYVVLETTALPLGYSPIMLSAKDCFVKTQPIQFNNGMVGVFSIVSGRFKN